MISYHRNTKQINLEYLYSGGYVTSNTDDPRIISMIINTYVNSPIQWNGGIRKRDNFIKTSWIALDFDSGVKLKDILKEVKDMIHVVGTTKRHRIAKENSTACDRFRVWLKLERDITNLYEFEACMRWYQGFFGSDIQALDGARKFMPCKEIVSVSTEGMKAPVFEKLLDIRMERKYVDYSMFKDGKLPRWIEEKLQVGVTDGSSRNMACFKLGVHMTKLGYSVKQIVDMIMNSPIPLDSTKRREVELAVVNGSKK